MTSTRPTASSTTSSGARPSRSSRSRRARHARKQAKELLDAKGVAYRAFELDEDALGAGMRARLGKRTGRTSVPSIWIGGECVGGLNDGNPGLVPLEERGELDAKLRAAGVLR